MEQVGPSCEQDPLTNMESSVNEEGLAANLSEVVVRCNAQEPVINAESSINAETLTEKLSDGEVVPSREQDPVIKIESHVNGESLTANISYEEEPVINAESCINAECLTARLSDEEVGPSREQDPVIKMESRMNGESLADIADEEVVRSHAQDPIIHAESVINAENVAAKLEDEEVGPSRDQVLVIKMESHMNGHSITASISDEEVARSHAQYPPINAESGINAPSLTAEPSDEEVGPSCEQDPVINTDSSINGEGVAAGISGEESSTAVWPHTQEPTIDTESVINAESLTAKFSDEEVELFHPGEPAVSMESCTNEDSLKAGELDNKVADSDEQVSMTSTEICIEEQSPKADVDKEVELLREQDPAQNPGCIIDEESLNMDGLDNEDSRLPETEGSDQQVLMTGAEISIYEESSIADKEVALSHHQDPALSAMSSVHKKTMRAEDLDKLEPSVSQESSSNVESMKEELDSKVESPNQHDKDPMMPTVSGLDENLKPSVPDQELKPSRVQEPPMGQDSNSNGKNMEEGELDHKDEPCDHQAPVTEILVTKESSTDAILDKEDPIQKICIHDVSLNNEVEPPSQQDPVRSTDPCTDEDSLMANHSEKVGPSVDHATLTNPDQGTTVGIFKEETPSEKGFLALLSSLFPLSLHVIKNTPFLLYFPTVWKNENHQEVPSAIERTRIVLSLDSDDEVSTFKAKHVKLGPDNLDDTLEYHPLN